MKEGFVIIMQTIIAVLGKLYKKLPVITLDVAVIPFAWYFAYWLRFNMELLPRGFVTTYSLGGLLILAMMQVACYYYFKVYRGLWRFSSLNDLVRIIWKGRPMTS